LAVCAAEEKHKNKVAIKKGIRNEVLSSIAKFI
jgi:hypothetical protein